MTSLLCWIWPYLCGAFLGWLLSGLLARLFRTPAPVVERIVEKTVEKQVDNPAHLARIRSLEGEVGLIAGLRSQIQQLQAAPPKTVEKVVEKIVDRPVEKIVDRVIEVTVPDTQALEEKDRVIAGLRAQLAERDAAPPALDLAAAKAAGFNVKGEDNLEIVEGIGPKIADLLRANGVTRFYALARMSPAAIKAILERGGPNFALAVPDSWPEQADLIARNQWTALKALQDVLVAGVRK